MAGNWENIFGFKIGTLLQNCSTNFCESIPIFFCLKSLQASSRLNRLKGNAPDGFLFQCIFNNLANFAIIESFFEGNNQGSRNIKLVKVSDRLFPNYPQICASEFLKCRRFKAVKL